LLLLYRKAGVDKEQAVFAAIALTAGDKGGKAALHGAGDGHTAFGGHIHIYKCLNKTGGFRLELRMSVEHGVDGSYAFLQGCYFGFDSYFGGGKAGHAHFHTDVALAAAFFGLVHHRNDLSYGGFAEIG
jgi:hypothetical protein